MRGNDFITSKEFKSFIFKLKKNELSLQLQLGDSNEKLVGLVKKLKEYDPNSETLIVDEARELVKIS